MTQRKTTLDYDEIISAARKTQKRSAPSSSAGQNSLADQVWQELVGQQIAGTPIEKIPPQMVTESGTTPAREGITSKSQPRDLSRDVQRAGDIGIPIATQIGAGAIRGGPQGAFLGGLYGIGKETLGALGGLGLVQALGIGEPTRQEIAIATATPGAVRGLTSGIQLLPRLTPGVQAAEQQELIPGLRTSAERLIPRGKYSAQQLYNEAYLGGDVPMSFKETQATVGGLLSEQSILKKGFKLNQDARDVLEGTIELANDPQTNVNIVRAHIAQLNGKIREKSAGASGREVSGDDPSVGVMKAARRALLDDLETSTKGVQGNVGEAIRFANRQYRETIARDDLNYIIQKQGVTPSPGSNLYTIHPSKIKKWVESPDNEDWRRTIGEQKVKEFVAFLDTIAPYEKSLKGGLRFEAMKLGGTFGGAIGGGIGTGLAGPWGGAAGVATGSVAGTYMMEHIGEWFLTPKGQSAVKALLKFSRGSWSTKESSALTTAMIRTIGDEPLSNEVMKGIYEESQP